MQVWGDYVELERHTTLGNIDGSADGGEVLRGDVVEREYEGR